MTSIRLRPLVALTLATSLTAALTAGHASAQGGGWGTPEPPPEPQRRYDYQSVVERGYDHRGPYAQLGVAVGSINFDVSGVDDDAAGGFTMTGGYRFLPWLSGEANFTLLGGEVDVDGFAGDADALFYAFTFGPKIYPMPLLEQPGQRPLLPESAQPYFLVGIGGGEVQLEVGGSESEESTFVARFIGGIDLWLNQNLGVYLEGGYHVASEDDVDGAGLFTVGGQWRF